MFKIISKHGLILDRFDDLQTAIDCMDRWPQAVAVIASTEVIARKEKLHR